MEDSYIVDGKDVDRQRLIDALNDAENFKPKSKEKKWLPLVIKLPPELKFILLSELLSENTIDSIQNANWPQKGSIVISLRRHLKNDIPNNSKILKYRILNDPHYWYDEISQKTDGVEHLIITCDFSTFSESL